MSSDGQPGRGAAPPVSRLVAAGVGGVRVVFGAAGEPVAAAELVAAGSGLFSDAAAADVVGVLMTNDRPTVEVALGAPASRPGGSVSRLRHGRVGGRSDVHASGRAVA